MEASPIRFSCIQILIVINRFQFFAMIVGQSQKFSSMSWLENAQIASHILLGKQEAKVARVVAGKDLVI